MSLSNFFLYFNIPVALVALLIGAGAILRPQVMSIKFGIPAEPKALPYVMSLGIRDIFMGLSILILFFLSDWYTLGLIHLCLGLVASCDFFVVFKNGVRETSFVHLLGAILSFSYGAWLIYYSSSVA
jgi:hypothetical protein